MLISLAQDGRGTNETAETRLLVKQRILVATELNFNSFATFQLCFMHHFWPNRLTLCTTLILSVVCWILGLSVGKNQHLYTVCSTTLSNYSTKKASLKEVKSNVS